MEEVVVVSSGGGGGSYYAPLEVKIFSIDKALEFLSQNQKEDGSFGFSIYTDWVAMAVSINENSPIKLSITNYFKNNKFETSILTDYERHAMALMSLGINPYSDTEINYIKKIMDSFDGTQFGDPSLINDDLFALVVLKNAGYDSNDSEIVKDVNFIISKQSSSGSFGSIDMTAVALQAFSGLQDIEKVGESLTKAENYLIYNQKPNGSYGNTFTSSWVLQSLFTDSRADKINNYLALEQSTDGGVGGINDSIETRIWATAYAIPAVSHKPWSEILNKFIKPVVSPSTIKENEIAIKKEDILKIKTVEEKEVIKNTKINKKTVKEKKRKENNIPKTTKNTDKLESTLSANAVSSINQKRNQGILLNAVSIFVNKVKIPFIWFWHSLGF